MCSACRKEKETTEHVIACKEYKNLEVEVFDNCFDNCNQLRQAVDAYEIIQVIRCMLKN